MATRGLYKFYDDVERFNNKQTTAVIYRHWDNYLEEGGMDLLEFLTTLRDSNFDNRFTDSSYLASKFVVYLAREFADDWNNKPLDFISVGILPNNVDSWEEYTYHIYNEKIGEGVKIKAIRKHYESDDEIVFEGTPEELLTKIKSNA